MQGNRKRTQGLVAMVMGGVVALAGVALVPIAATAQDGDLSVGTATDDLGTYLVGPEGLTLYFFAADTTPGVSVCVDGCAEAWPPLLAAEGQAIVAADEGVTGTLGAVPRADGSLQVTYRGRPLYYWQNDAAPGDTTGQGVNDVWFVALADGTLPIAAEAPAAPDLTLATGSSDELGTFLTGADGRTIYFFAVDTTPGASACEGDCLAAWPPVTVPAGGSVAAGEGVTGVIGLITGTDGSTQVTYDGRPLYYWQGDTEAGQTTGHGVGDVWWVADVTGALPAPM